MNQKKMINYLIQSGTLLLLFCCLLLLSVVYRSCCWDLLQKENCSSVLVNEICQLIRYSY